jgi:phosphoglycerate dehydrogenase-like enzyme
MAIAPHRFCHRRIHTICLCAPWVESDRRQGANLALDAFRPRRLDSLTYAMTTATPPTIYCGTKTRQGIAARIRAAAPDCRVLTHEDIEREPSLRAVADVMIYGGDFDVAQWPSLRWIQSWAAGVSAQLLQAMAASEVTITNSSGIHAEPIAEHAFAMMLMFARRMPWVLARGGWAGRAESDGADVLAGHTLGIVGLGAIGERMARVGDAFRMRVLAIRRHPQPADGVEWVGVMDDLPRLLGESDYVVNLLPLTDETLGVFGSAQFAAMKHSAVYTNFGRGATTDKIGRAHV